MTAARLTDVERAERRLTGEELQAQICDVLALTGWSWLEVGALRTKYGWRTPTRGPLGEGWPDIFAIRVRDGRRIAIEVKRELEVPRASQVAVLAALDLCGVPTVVLRPSDLRDPLDESVVYRLLR